MYDHQISLISFFKMPSDNFVFVLGGGINTANLLDIFSKKTPETFECLIFFSCWFSLPDVLFSLSFLCLFHFQCFKQRFQNFKVPKL